MKLKKVACSGSLVRLLTGLALDRSINSAINSSINSSSSLLSRLAVGVAFSMAAPGVLADSGALAALPTPAPASVEVPQWPGTTWTGPEGAVATVHPEASKAAAQVLKDGGSAADAAIAAALTLGVVDGFNSGIGGGLFALIRYPDGQIEAIDAREAAPACASRDMYLRNGQLDPQLSKTGPLASGIPGSVVAFEYLSKKAGLLRLQSLYNNAADLAEAGFRIIPHYHFRINRVKNQLTQSEARALLLDPSGQAWPAGHKLLQPHLAASYRHIGLHGADWFYKGEFAQITEQWMQQAGGCLAATDFADYRLKVRQAVRSKAFGLEWIGFPPPSSGGLHIAQMLSLLEQLGFDKADRGLQLHWLAEVMKLAFADRSTWVGDPDFVDIPDWLTNPDYLAHRAGQLSPLQASPVLPGDWPLSKASGLPLNPSDSSMQFTAGSSTLTGTLGKDGIDPLVPDLAALQMASDEQSKHTTHVSVADANGVWVSMTSTVNTTFGSKMMVPGTGIFLNNQMDDFAAQPGVPNAYGLIANEANAIAPGKRPLSSMTPLLVLKEGKPVMAVGAAGGPMIINQVLQAVINSQVFGMPLAEALYQPRLHHQWQPDVLYVESRLSQADRQALASRRHVLKDLSFEGSTNAVAAVPCSKPSAACWQAASEPRLLARNASVN